MSTKEDYLAGSGNVLADLRVPRVPASVTYLGHTCRPVRAYACSELTRLPEDFMPGHVASLAAVIVLASAALPGPALGQQRAIAINIPAQFPVNFPALSPSACWKVARPADGRITAQVVGPGNWDLCIGDASCPMECGGGLRSASTEPLTKGPSYFVRVETQTPGVTATLKIFPTAGGGLPPRPGRWVNTSHPAHYFEQRDGEWLEFNDGRNVYRYSHKQTTSQFVEMYDAGRRVTVRIYADHDEWSTDMTKWTTSVYGTWQDAPPPGNPPTATGCPVGSWRSTSSTWVITQTSGGGGFAQETGAGNAKGPCDVTPSGSFLIRATYVGGSATFEFRILPDGRAQGTWNDSGYGTGPFTWAPVK
jgi:hypothetical protein